VAYAVTVLAAGCLGFVAGLLSFRVKTKWCRSCGRVKSCPKCSDWVHPLAPNRYGYGATRDIR